MEKSAEAFRTISEVAQDLDLPQHVLRFWETRFVQIRPLKRGGGRRYYRPEDVDLLRAIRQLLYGEGYTIKGVQKILKEQGPRGVAAAYGGEGVLAPLPVEAAMLPHDEADDSGEGLDAAAEDAMDFGANQGPSPRPAAGEDASWIEAFPERIASAPPRAGGLRGPTGRKGPALALADIELLHELLGELVECARILDAARGV